MWLCFLEAYSLDLVLLDEQMGERSGCEVCRVLRARRDDTLVLLVTTSESINLELQARAAGADGFLAKSRGLAVLKATVDGIDRVHRRAAARKLEAGPLRLDRSRGAVTVDGVEVTLRPKEFALLALLASKPGELWPARQIGDKLWSFDRVPDANVVAKQVGRLRAALAGTSAAAMLVTRRGMGYIFDPTAREAAAR